MTNSEVESQADATSQRAGYTPAQLVVLYNQVMAHKLISKALKRKVPAGLQEHHLRDLKPPPLGSGHMPNEISGELSEMLNMLKKTPGKKQGVSGTSPPAAIEPAPPAPEPSAATATATDEEPNVPKAVTPPPAAPITVPTAPPLNTAVLPEAAPLIVPPSGGAALEPPAPAAAAVAATLPISGALPAPPAIPQLPATTLPSSLGVLPIVASLKMPPPPAAQPAPAPAKGKKEKKGELEKAPSGNMARQGSGRGRGRPRNDQKQQQQQQLQQQQQQQQALITPAADRMTGPLFVLNSGQRAAEQQTAIASVPGAYLQAHTMELDISTLLQSEYNRRLQRHLPERISELESLLPRAQDPGMRYSSGVPPFGAVLLELKMLRARHFQAELRAAIEKEAFGLLGNGENNYRVTQRRHRSQRIETARKDIDAKRELGAARARDIKTFRSEVMGENMAGVRDLRVARNRGVTRAHERLARERNKLKGDDRTLRLEALRAHDFEAYQEMLRRQTGGLPAADERYEAISKFLADTEDYLHRLASKIASVKVSAEASNAAAQAVAEARQRGLSEEEVQAAAKAAAAEAASGSDLVHRVAGTDAQSMYYQVAHSTQEAIAEQPALLCPPGDAKLREYQMVGLQWMVSLYNNHLNGILADEMGLGKTVQVMALIAYLMEHKKNFGPHLIVVPNAVTVNWRSELTQWLPSSRCVYYVGNKEERKRKYEAEVQPLQFNILVTTYELIMKDATKLAKIDWKYIIIDEAQRMKDRESKLARDLAKFKAERRLLLSGTPLQNDLRELWSLLNLLLPNVFDDKKIFGEWFGGIDNAATDDWLAKEKRVVVIHRLHQILEPFMLRRQVEDVETKLPPKIAMTIKVPMSAHQSAIYDWVKTTGTLRLDPSSPVIGKVAREYASLQNKCMELRKICNHPLLTYPPNNWGVGDMIVRQCGKMVVLDRMLVKLKQTGHRVLLFSTMTKLLDLIEVYLQWRKLPNGKTMQYLRIDGSTALEDREIAIKRFNAEDSECFIFLLSIRAAGRGLNLQSADTVIIYDPDPNPKNEEQAIARSHRIGQTKEVRVVHFEAVAEPPRNQPQHQHAQHGHLAAAEPAPSVQPPPPLSTEAPVPIPDPGVAGSNGAGPSTSQGAPSPAAAPAPAPEPETEPSSPGRKLYADSIESLVRNQIQRIKIEMANEVIDAGRFDQQTTMEERRHTLETLLQDPDRNRKAVNEVPTWTELNKMLARGDDELELFTKLDNEFNWLDPTSEDNVPPWMKWNEADLRGAIALSSKHRPDLDAEIAALTGVVHHVHPHPHGANAPSGKPPAAAPSAAPAVAAAMAPMTVIEEMERVPAEPAMTTTTTRSSLGAEEEDEEVVMEDNDEEEEVLEQNLVTEDLDGTTTEAGAGTGGNSGGENGAKSIPRVESTAHTTGTLEAPSPAAAGAGAGAQERRPEVEEPAAKRRRSLSVHFEDDLKGEAPMQEDPPADGN